MNVLVIDESVIFIYFKRVVLFILSYCFEQLIQNCVKQEAHV